jgi:hypothetical protein
MRLTLCLLFGVALGVALTIFVQGLSSPAETWEQPRRVITYDLVKRTPLTRKLLGYKQSEDGQFDVVLCWNNHVPEPSKCPHFHFPLSRLGCLSRLEDCTYTREGLLLSRVFESWPKEKPIEVKFLGYYRRGFEPEAVFRKLGSGRGWFSLKEETCRTWLKKAQKDGYDEEVKLLQKLLGDWDNGPEFIPPPKREWVNTGANTAVGGNGGDAGNGGAGPDDYK